MKARQCLPARWHLVVEFMAAAITRARIRHTAAKPQELLPPFSFRLWDPFDVWDPLLDDLERSPFFSPLVLTLPTLLVLGRRCCRLGRIMESTFTPTMALTCLPEHTHTLELGDIDRFRILELGLGLPFLHPLPLSVFSCLCLQFFPLVRFPARKSQQNPVPLPADDGLGMAAAASFLSDGDFLVVCLIFSKRFLSR